MLPLDFRDLSIEMDPQEGDELGICSRDAGISDCNGKEILVTYYASCVPPARGMRGSFRGD